jgi:hypothetical protein
VSLSSGDEVPHIFTRKSRLQPGEFLITSAKRLLQQYLPTADSCTAANSILRSTCWDICRRVGEAGIAKDMPNKSFGRTAELNVGPDRRRLATTDNWWETVLWLTPSIIKS